MKDKKQIVFKKTKELIPYINNSRTHNEKQIKQIAGSINEFGFTNPILIDENNNIIAGHGRLLASNLIGLKEVPTIILKNLTKAQKKAYIIADNKIALNADWNFDLLKIELDDLIELDFDMDLIGFEKNELDFSFNEDKYKDGVKGSLQENFIAPPFSVLDTKQGYWKDRKKMWLNLGLKSEEGRENLKTTVASSSIDKGANDGGGSVFDPVVCEIAYTWFSSKDDKVIDPFAGGSVRGVIAGKLNREYTGIDLRNNQVIANKKQAKFLMEKKDTNPIWIQGDSNKVLDKIKNDEFDFCISCPPYADLEVYSDNPSDLSNMDYKDFKKIYYSIIKKLYQKMKDNTFVFWVIGEVRNKKGNYYNFFGDTIEAFLNAGFKYYNDIVLLTPIGSSALRAGNQFKKGRKVCKTHQNILVFCKGDGKKSTKKLGDVKVDIKKYIEENEE